MKRLALLELARGATAARPDKPAMTLVHDSPDARVVVFRIGPGQQVPPHTSTSSVIATVMDGEGVFTGGDGEETLATGESVAYAPSEPHGFRATARELVVMAVIAPRPGG